MIKIPESFRFSAAAGSHPKHILNGGGMHVPAYRTYTVAVQLAVGLAG